MIVYVDDFLILAPASDMRAKLKLHLESIWDMCAEKPLNKEAPLKFLGLELQQLADGTIVVHQHSFIQELLVKHGYHASSGGDHITMEAVTEEPPPTAAELKTLQSYAGELNWLATRSRADLAYDVSILASCLGKHPQWAFRFWRKIMRYLKGTADACLTLPATGDESVVEVWSDAGFGGSGTGTKSQSGLFLSWGRAPRPMAVQPPDGQRPQHSRGRAHLGRYGLAGGCGLQGAARGVGDHHPHGAPPPRQRGGPSHNGPRRVVAHALLRRARGQAARGGRRPAFAAGA